MKIGAADPQLACEQHATLATALRSAGARVLRLPFLHGAFDSVFMKDSAILAGTRALPTTFRHGERAPEAAARAAQLRRAGFVVAKPLASQLEGGDVCVIPHRALALLGHGVRSSRDSTRGLAQFLGCDVMTLELVDDSLFHLDVALTVLADDTLAYCPAAFTPAARRTIEALAFSRVIEISAAEAARFSLNIVEVGTTIVTGTPSAYLWESLGRRVIVAPLDQFQLAGGSAACLVARLNEFPATHSLAA